MSLRPLTTLVLICATALPGLAQTRQLTSNDYAGAEKFMGYNTNPLVLHVPARPVWSGDDRFWYRVTTERGTEFILIDPIRGTRAPAFDQTRVAAALSSASGTSYQPFRLPFTQFTFEQAGRAIAFDLNRRHWTCDVQGTRCSSSERNAVADGVVSPDGKQAAFIRDFNLWAYDI